MQNVLVNPLFYLLIYHWFYFMRNRRGRRTYWNIAGSKMEQPRRRSLVASLLKNSPLAFHLSFLKM
jgi:hypothetical protein